MTIQEYRKWLKTQETDDKAFPPEDKEIKDLTYRKRFRYVKQRENKKDTCPIGSPVDPTDDELEIPWSADHDKEPRIAAVIVALPKI